MCAFAVAGLWLLARWIVDLLAAPEYFDSFEAIGLLSTGVALYALYLVLVVILGRTGRTEFNLPATIAGTVVNLVCNLVLIPPLGIVGAGIALVASYLVVLVLMYVLTQRLFPVPYEWGRLAVLVGVTAATVAAGELLLPTEGLGGLAARTLLWLALPVFLLATGFLSREERAGLRMMLSPEAVRERLRALASEPQRPEARLGGRLLGRGLRGGPSRRGPALAGSLGPLAGVGGEQRAQALVLLAAGGAAVEMGREAGNPRVGVLARELELDVAVEELEAAVAADLLGPRAEQALERLVATRLAAHLSLPRPSPTAPDPARQASRAAAAARREASCRAPRASSSAARRARRSGPR